LINVFCVLIRLIFDHLVMIFLDFLDRGSIEKHNNSYQCDTRDQNRLLVLPKHIEMKEIVDQTESTGHTSNPKNDSLSVEGPDIHLPSGCISVADSLTHLGVRFRRTVVRVQWDGKGNCIARLAALWPIGILLCCCSAMAAAYGVVGQSDEATMSCAHAAPGSITAALFCADKAEAMRQLDEAGCFAGAPAVLEVRNVWLARESLLANAAARDRKIQLFMAECLVEAHSKTHSPNAAEVSAVAYLRAALKESDPQISGVAMIALAPVLAKDDIDMIVRLGSTQSALAMPAVTALSIACTPESKSGIAAIQSVYAGSEQGNEIQRLVAGNAGLCGDNGHARRAEFSGKVFVPLPAPRGNER
jgi:hypothetical protein